MKISFAPRFMAAAALFVAVTMACADAYARKRAVDHSKTYTFQKEEIWCVNARKQIIYGEAYVPDAAKKGDKLPLVIVCHGFGADHGTGTGYAAKLAEKGYMAYAFDFCGGGNNVRSGGKTEEMSVRTEEEDLLAVLKHFKNDRRVDRERIYIMGGSQGGLVTALTIADHPDNIRAAVLLYPAFVIPDDARKRFPDRTKIPDFVEIWGMKLGRIYADDTYDMNPYEIIGNFKKPVIMIHGTNDKIVPISYSERALKVYPNSSLVKIEGAEHGFWGKYFEPAAACAISFLNNVEKDKNYRPAKQSGN